MCPRRSWTLGQDQSEVRRAHRIADPPAPHANPIGQLDQPSLVLPPVSPHRGYTYAPACASAAARRWLRRRFCSESTVSTLSAAHTRRSRPAARPASARRTRQTPVRNCSTGVRYCSSPITEQRHPPRGRGEEDQRYGGDHARAGEQQRVAHSGVAELPRRRAPPAGSARPAPEAAALPSRPSATAPLRPDRPPGSSAAHTSRTRTPAPARSTAAGRSRPPGPATATVPSPIGHPLDPAQPLPEQHHAQHHRDERVDEVAQRGLDDLVAVDAVDVEAPVAGDQHRGHDQDRQRPRGRPRAPAATPSSAGHAMITSTKSSDQTMRCATISTEPAGFSSGKYSGNMPQSRYAEIPYAVPRRRSFTGRPRSQR